MKTGRGVEKESNLQNDAIKEFDWLTLAIIQTWKNQESRNQL